MGDRDVVIPISAPGADRAAADIGKVAQSGSLLANAFGKVFGAGAGSGLLQFGQLFAGASAVTSGMRAAAGIIAGLSGDSSKMIQNFEKLPLGLGQAVQAAHELYDVINNTAERSQAIAAGASAQGGVQRLFASDFKGAGSMADAVQSLKDRASMAGLSGTDLAAARVKFDQREQMGQLKAMIDASAATHREGLRGVFGKFGGEDTAAETVAPLNEEIHKLIAVRRDLNAQLEDLKSKDITRGQFTLKGLIGTNEARIADLKARADPINNAFSAAHAMDLSFSSDQRSAREGAFAIGEIARKNMFKIFDDSTDKGRGSSMFGDLRGAGPAIEGRLLTGATQQYDPQNQGTRGVETNSAITTAEATKQTVDLLRMILNKISPEVLVAGVLP